LQDHDIMAYMELLRVNGTFCIVGVPSNPMSIHAFPVIAKRKRLVGSLIGGIKETQEMLDFCGRHNITCDIELVKAQDINECYERAIKSDVKYRFVIDTASLQDS
jgi:alcohol dehydrogenase (NADP+)